MNVSLALVMDQIWRADSPEKVRDLILQLGFNGLVFQRWRREVIENWEASIPRGFLELYYGEELDRVCPVARAIHSWTRSYTFSEARRELANPANRAVEERIERLFASFDLNDGVVVLTGSQSARSSVILTSESPCDARYEELGGVLQFAAHKLDRLLVSGHPVLGLVPRNPPKLSEVQAKILKMQIDNPEMSSAEMARALGMSPKTLQAHHKKIAKKTGVTSFTGAVLRHLQQTS